MSCSDRIHTIVYNLRSVFMLMLCIAVVPLPVHAQNPTPQKLAASIGMLRTPEQYPPDFLLMALENLSLAPPSWLLTVLVAIEECDYAATNWLKLAGDEIVDRHRHHLDDFPLETLLTLSENWELSPFTRTIANEWLDQCAARPTAQVTQYNARKLTSHSGTPPGVEASPYWTAGHGILWKTSLQGKPVASPHVVSLTQFPRSSDLIVSCHDIAGGQCLWSQTLVVPTSWAGKVDSHSDHVAFQIAESKEGEITILHGRHGVTAFTLNGELRWIHPLSGDLAHLDVSTQHSTELLLLTTKKNVFTQIRTAKASAIVCLDAEDGQLQWRRKSPSASEVASLLVDTKDETTLVTVSAHQIDGLSTNNGDVRWSVSESQPICCTGFEPRERRIVYQSGSISGKTLKSLDLESCGPMKTILPLDLQGVAHLVVHQQQVLKLTAENDLICQDRDTGETLWVFPMQGKVFWPPTQGQNHLYVTNQQGQTLILGGSSALFVNGSGDLGEKINRPPVIAKSGLIFQLEGQLICVKAPVQDGAR